MPRRQKSKSNKQSAFQTWTSTHPLLTALLILLSSFVGIVLFLAMLIGSYFLVTRSIDSAQRHALATTIEKEVISARAEKESGFDAAHQHKVDVLKSAGIVSEEDQAYSAKFDVCGMASVDRGWVATDWTQYCQFEYADILPTVLSREEIVSRLSSQPETLSLFGEVATGHYVKACGELYELSHRRSLNYYVWSVDSQGNLSKCGLAADKNGNYKSRNTDSPDIQTERTFRTSNLDTGKFYIGVFSDNEYYRSGRLGCSGNMFCNSPFEKPQSGFSR